MKFTFLTLMGVLLLSFSCQNSVHSDVLTINETIWTIDSIDELVNQAEQQKMKNACKKVKWIEYDNSAVPLDLKDSAETPEFNHEALNCNVGEGIVKYVYNEFFYEYEAVNKFYVKDGKLIFVCQEINSEGYVMNLKFYYNQDEELLKGWNTELLEEGTHKIKLEYENEYDKFIHENSVQAFDQFKMILEKFDH